MGGGVLKEVALLGLGALSLLRERMEALREAARRRGREVLSEIKERKDLLKARGEEERGRIKEGLRKLASLHPLFASKFEVEELRRRVEALEGRAQPAGETPEAQ